MRLWKQLLGLPPWLEKVSGGSCMARSWRWLQQHLHAHQRRAVRLLAVSRGNPWVPCRCVSQTRPAFPFSSCPMKSFQT